MLIASQRTLLRLDTEPSTWPSRRRGMFANRQISIARAKGSRVVDLQIAQHVFGCRISLAVGRSRNPWRPVAGLRSISDRADRASGSVVTHEPTHSNGDLLF
jgi:hypothetical protein